MAGSQGAGTAPVNAINRTVNNTKNQGIGYSYKLLLSLIIERPGIFNQVKEIVREEDYFGEPYRQVAQMLYRSA